MKFAWLWLWTVSALGIEIDLLGFDRGFRAPRRHRSRVNRFRLRHAQEQVEE